MMNQFRCSNCDKLLGMIEGKAEIKCSKCKTMNYVITEPSRGIIKSILEDMDAHCYEHIPKPFVGDIEIQVLEPITIKTSFDHEHVTRMTREEIKEKYGK